LDILGVSVRHIALCDLHTTDCLKQSASGTGILDRSGSVADHLVLIAFNLAQVDVEYRIMGLAHRPFATRTIDGDVLQGVDETGLVLEVAVDRIGAGDQQQPCVIPVDGINIWVDAIGLLIRLRDSHI